MKARIQTVRLLWLAHFVIGFCIICLGIASNGGARKYIPLNAESVRPECSKAYASVYAASEDNDDALICCKWTVDYSWSWLTGTYAEALCASTLPLPFARRLTKWPDAWLLPLVPILLRLIAFQTKRMKGLISERNFEDLQNYTLSSIRRVLFYILIMNFRGWTLFILFNRAQDAIVTHASLDTCWYRRYLPPNKQSDDMCYGRRFDFSDHVVLFFGHMLPVILFEALTCVVIPFWPRFDKSLINMECNQAKRGNFLWIRRLPSIFITSAFSISFFYLNLLIFLAATRTAAYFHTASEIAVGYLISLLVQIPLGILLWGTSYLGRWDQVRGLLGLPSFDLFTRDD